MLAILSSALNWQILAGAGPLFQTNCQSAACRYHICKCNLLDCCTCLRQTRQDKTIFTQQFHVLLGSATTQDINHTILKHFQPGPWPGLPTTWAEHPAGMSCNTVTVSILMPAPKPTPFKADVRVHRMGHCACELMTIPAHAHKLQLPRICRDQPHAKLLAGQAACSKLLARQCYARLRCQGFRRNLDTEYAVLQSYESKIHPQVQVLQVWPCLCECSWLVLLEGSSEPSVLCRCQQKLMWN